MPTYTLQGPSGKTYTVEGPEGATADQLGQFILSQSKDERVAQTRAQMKEQYSPTVGMGPLDRFAAAMGAGAAALGRGASQWLPGGASREDVKEVRALDAPLLETTAGKVGNFVGKAAPIIGASIVLPGMATLGGATALGAASGAIEPSESTGETLRNIAIGGVAGAAGQKIGNVIADKLAQRAANKAAQFTSQQAANAQRLTAAKAASGEGYVIPPSDIQPQGPLMEALGGLSGKIKTAQVASAKNQQVTDALARKAVGLNPEDELSRQVLGNIRQQAGQAYNQFRGVGQVQADQAYTQALDTVEQTLKGASKSFPGLKSDKVADLVQTMRQPSFDAGDAIDATKVLRELAEGAYAQGDKQLGKAYRAVSDALEGSLERHLQGVAPDMVPAFREARQLIAKTYTVEKALNGQTGEVSAQALAQALKKGKPLSGELRTIAETAEAFPKATQALKEAPKALSPLDWAVGAMTGTATGNPLTLALMGARPLTRSALLSPAVQANAMKQLTVPSSRIADLASNPLARLLYGPIGADAGLTAMNSR